MPQDPERAEAIRRMRRDWKVRSYRLPLVRTLEADCPWLFAAAGRQGGTRDRYQPMSLDQLCSYPLPPLAPDVRLFFWRVGALQQEALTVGRAWGFTQKSEIVWVKTTGDGRLLIDTNEMGNDEVVKDKSLTNLAYGNGHQTRYAHETCLIMTRGNPERTAHFRSVFFAPRGEHSQKPAKFYSIAAAMSPGPRYRLFACDSIPGWTSEYHMAHRGEHAQPDAVDSEDATPE